MARFLYDGPPTCVSLGGRDIPLSPGCHFDADPDLPYVKRLAARGMARLVSLREPDGPPRRPAHSNGHACGMPPAEPDAETETETETETDAPAPGAARRNRHRRDS
jgi:hypothetical protein